MEKNKKGFRVISFARKLYIVCPYLSLVLKYKKRKRKKGRTGERTSPSSSARIRPRFLFIFGAAYTRTHIRTYIHTLFTRSLSPFPPASGGRHNTAAVLSPVSFRTIRVPSPLAAPSRQTYARVQSATRRYANARFARLQLPLKLCVPNF